MKGPRRLNSIPLEELKLPIKILFCPGCEKEFSGTDKVSIRGGLVLCPDCAVELALIKEEVK